MVDKEVTELLVLVVVAVVLAAVAVLALLFVEVATSAGPEFCLARGAFAGGNGGVEVVLEIVVISFTFE